VSDEAIERDERRAPSRAVTHHGNDVHRRPSPERADLDPEGHATSPAFARRATGRPPVRPKWRAVRPADRQRQFRAERRMAPMTCSYAFTTTRVGLGRA